MDPYVFTNRRFITGNDFHIHHSVLLFADLNVLVSVRSVTALELIVHSLFTVPGVFLQSSVVIFMRPNHYKLQDLIFLNAVGKEVLCSMYFEFVHENAS